MRKTFTVAVLTGILAAASCSVLPRDPQVPMAVAHRGCHLKDADGFYINENCPEGVRMARRYGYPAIELDVKYTSDSVMVVMHDKSINRTMRRASDYGPVEEKVLVSETPFEVLRRDYVLVSSDPALRRPIPTLEEMLQACKEEGVVAMLHSALSESYRMAQEMLGDEGWIAFSSFKSLKSVRDFSNCLILMNSSNGTVEDVLPSLGAIGSRCGISSMNYKMMDAAYIKTLRDAGYEVQASIFPVPHEQRALRDGVSIELSDFFWFQKEGRKPVSTWKERGRSLAEGDSLVWSADPLEYGAVTLEINFSGDLTIDLGGGFTYTLSHSEPATELLGIRLFRRTPSIRITAPGPAVIRGLRANLYEL
ncbi:MAG: hypothetical protein J5495_01970 [Bacteroidales bacterium]|nr:hypothetical protein [Bacteroidales bacterium]